LKLKENHLQKTYTSDKLERVLGEIRTTGDQRIWEKRGPTKDREPFYVKLFFPRAPLPVPKGAGCRAWESPDGESFSKEGVIFSIAWPTTKGVEGKEWKDPGRKKNSTVSPKAVEKNREEKIA